MLHLLCFTPVTALLTACFLVVLFLLVRDFLKSRGRNEEKDELPQPPSPKGYPIIGHLHLLGGYEVPYQAFTELGKKYGSVLKLKLGSYDCVIVNGQKNIKEALVTKGHHFDSRPNFERYQQLFCGNKENSLAFCDWSDTQKVRRDMLKAYTFPRAFTNKFNSLENIISSQVHSLLAGITEEAMEAKPLILQHCANIFTSHFCSKSFDLNDPNFLRMVENFDDIFWEVNQGYAADFLPFLLPLHYKNLQHINELTHNIRDFVLDKIIESRFDDYTNEEPADYVESLIQYIKTEDGNDLTWDMALFALEDILGGHSAVGNFLIKLLAYLVKEEEVQRKIQAEIDEVSSTGDGFREITISDRAQMPYTEAAIFEAIRLIASPIVPRVANQHSSINGYRIKKGDIIFMNNYDLSMSEKLWDEPELFKPERFIVGGRLIKPEHFLPFGGGRRSCMGYKMVQLVSFGILSGLLQNFCIRPVESQVYKVPVGSLALPKKSFSFRFVRR